MPAWKKYTDMSGRRVDVNPDTVAYMASYDDVSTNIFFCAGKGDAFLELRVKGNISELQDNRSSATPFRA